MIVDFLNIEKGLFISNRLHLNKKRFAPQLSENFNVYSFR